MAQLLCVGFVILAVGAVYGMVRLFASRGMATIAAVAVATMPWMTMLAPVAYVEGLLVLYAVLAIAWAIVALGRDDRGSWFAAVVIGGACAGLACGVKLTAGPMVLAAVGGGYLVAGLIFRHCARRAIYGSVIFVVIGLLVVSPWLLRNWAWVGNPVFPNATEFFGAGYFSPGQVDRFTAAHTVPPGSDGPIAASWHQIAGYWQYGFVLIPLALAGLVLAGCQRSRDSETCAEPTQDAGLGVPRPVGPDGFHAASMFSSSVVLAIVALIVQWIFWAFFTHRIGRFFLPGIAPLALLLVGLNRKQFAVRTAAVVVAGGALFAFFIASHGGLHARMTSFAALGREGVFGLQKMGSLHPDLQSIYDRGGVVHFVGDAKLFLHNAPSAQLPYRTVFDLRADTDDVITAWTGKPLSQLPEGQWVLIDPEEIHRLATTYRHVPDLPDDFPGPRNRPFLMNRQGEVVVPR
jgi:4-amino-4-deoxy-L-arabinose transferase-like glycosyltransferase